MAAFNLFCIMKKLIEIFITKRGYLHFIETVCFMYWFAGFFGWHEFTRDGKHFEYACAAGGALIGAFINSVVEYYQSAETRKANNTSFIDDWQFSDILCGTIGGPVGVIIQYNYQSLNPWFITIGFAVFTFEVIRIIKSRKK